MNNFNAPIKSDKKDKWTMNAPIKFVGKYFKIVRPVRSCIHEHKRNFCVLKKFYFKTSALQVYPN